MNFKKEDFLELLLHCVIDLKYYLVEGIIDAKDMTATLLQDMYDRNLFKVPKRYCKDQNNVTTKELTLYFDILDDKYGLTKIIESLKEDC